MSNKNNQDTNNFPDKTSSIDKLITVKEDVKKVIAGLKTATRRNKRHADVGDVLILDDHKFIIKNVYSQALGEMTDANAQQEGFENLEQYIEKILSLHPDMKWVPAMKVWVHEFERVD